MDKTTVLKKIENAKQEHKNMLENASLIVDGLRPQYKSIPQDPKECNFGKWFYNDGKKLSALSNNPMECIQNIDLLHNEFHTTYFAILSLYEKKSSGGLLKLFSKNELSNEEKTKLQELYEEIKNAYEKLLNELSKMQRRLQATPEEKFNVLE